MRLLPHLLCMLCPTLWMGWSAAQAAEPFVLVRDTGLYFAPAETVLVLRNGAGYQERWAAKEFVEYVHRASATRTLLPQAYGSVPEGWSGSAIILGVAGQAPFEDVDPAEMPMHGFQLRTELKRLVMIGASEQGASNALYWLLREKIGVRWYMPTRLGEEVPVHKEIVFEAMDVTLGPEIPSSSADARHYGTVGNTTPLGLRRDEMTRHIWGEIVLPSSENKRDHPEWFALTDRRELPEKDWMLKFLWIDVEGDVRSNQVCTSNAKVVSMFAEAAIRFFRENPDAQMFSVSPNDYHEFCTCANCKSLDAELKNGPLTNRLVYFFNQIAAEVRKQFPDKRLGFTAYSSHVDPPTTVKPDPMIWPALCFFGSRACYQHAMDDATCPVNKAWKESVFDGWAALVSDFGYYSYYGYSSKWMGPQLLVRHLARDLRLMHGHGCTRFHVDGWSNWATNAPMNYLRLRLPWDVDANPQTILDEWYRGTYGPAYGPMKQFWQTLIEGRYQVKHSPSRPQRPDLMFTRPIIARAWEHLRRAEQAVAGAGDRYKRRVAIARAGLEFTDPMALAYGLAAEGRFDEAVDAGLRALQVIIDTRKIEPEPYYKPMYPRDEHTWVWYRSWDGSLSAEKMTQEIIEGWKLQAKQAAVQRTKARFKTLH